MLTKIRLTVWSPFVKIFGVVNVHFIFLYDMNILDLEHGDIAKW